MAKKKNRRKEVTTEEISQEPLEAFYTGSNDATYKDLPLIPNTRYYCADEVRRLREQTEEATRLRVTAELKEEFGRKVLEFDEGCMDGKRRFCEFAGVPFPMYNYELKVQFQSSLSWDELWRLYHHLQYSGRDLVVEAFNANSQRVHIVDCSLNENEEDY